MKKSELLEQARDLALAGKHKEALPFLLKAAKSGLAEANYALSTWYYHGQGVRKNFKEAIKYARLAAAKGYSDSAFNLGVSYEKGQGGLKKDLKLALNWYFKALKLGDKGAASEIARIYYYGIGRQKDLKKALKYYKIAAKSDPKKWGIIADRLDKKLKKK